MQQGRLRQRGGIARLAAASGLVLGVYVAVVAVLPLDVFWHPDEGAKFFGVLTVRWDGSDWALPYLGDRIDPKHRFALPRHTIYPAQAADGSIEFRWPTFFPTLVRPLYEAFGMVGLYILPVLCGWLVATLSGLWTYRFRPGAAAPAVLLCGLATPIAFYSVCFFEHTLTTLLAALALTALVWRPGRASSLLLVTLLVAPAVMMRIEVLAFAAALWLTWILTAFLQRRWQPRGLLRSSRAVLLLAVVTLAVVALLVVLLGDIVPPRHLEVLTNGPEYLSRFWRRREYLFNSVVRIFLGEVSLTDPSYVRLWQIAALMALGGLIAAPFADTRAAESALILPSLLVLLQTALLSVLHMMPFLERQGVLAAAPFMSISLYALPIAWRRRDPHLFALVCAGALYTVFGFGVLFMLRVAQHDGGMLLGLDGAARYMILLYPIGAALGALVLAEYRASDAPPALRLLFSAMVGALMLVSGYYEILGVRELMQKREVLVRWRDEIAGSEPLLTDVWWLPGVLAPEWANREAFFLADPRSARRWVSLAVASKVERFTYMTTQYRVDPEYWAISGTRTEVETRSIPGLNISKFQVIGASRGSAAAFPLDVPARGE